MTQNTQAPRPSPWRKPWILATPPTSRMTWGDLFNISPFFSPSITFLGKWLGWKLSERLGTQQALESDDCPPHGAHGCLEGHGRSHEAQRAPLSRVPAVPVPGGPCGLAFHSSCPSSQRLAFFSSLEMEQEAGRVQGRKASPATAEARGCLPVFVNGSTAHSSTRSVVPAASIRDGHRPETSYPGAREPRSDAGRPLGLPSCHVTLRPCVSHLPSFSATSRALL